MIEDEIRQEIQEESRLHKEKCEEGLLFPKEKWNELVKWKPVYLDPYENAPREVKDYHENYVSLWNLRTKNKGR